VMLEQFLKFGLDIREEPMEVAPTAHHVMGGLRITPEAGTTVPGLFACGEVAGGVHGANRLGGNALADTQVFGRRAGESAGRSPTRSSRIERGTIDAYEERLATFFEGDVSPSIVIRSLKTAMWEGAGIFRTEKGLKKTLDVIAHLSSLRLIAKTEENFIECCTAQNMLLSASLVVKGALLRKESRGAHMRKDVVQTWDARNSPYKHTYQSIERCGIEMVARA